MPARACVAPTAAPPDHSPAAAGDHGHASRAGQAAELAAWSAAQGREPVPGCVEAGPDTPGAVTERQVGPLTEVRLWNFATGSDRPKAAHVRALIDLLVTGTLADARVELEGLASPAGDGPSNAALAHARAAAIAALLPDVPIQRVDAQVADAPATGDSARDRAVILRILPTPQAAPEPVAPADPWRPDPKTGELPNGFVRRGPPADKVAHAVIWQWPPIAQVRGHQTSALMGSAAARTLGPPSPAAGLSGRAGQTGEAIHGATSLGLPPTAETIERGLIDAIWSDFEVNAAGGHIKGLPPCGFDPAYRLVDVNGEVLDTFVHDSVMGG